MPMCRESGCSYEGTLRQLKRHYKKEHAGETWTPEEHLPDDQSEQRDFAGEEPTESGHSPEYLTDDAEDGDNEESPETRRTSLREYAEDTEET